jgi:hypothetical protein
MISRPSRRRSIADIGAQVTPRLTTTWASIPELRHRRGPVESAASILRPGPGRRTKDRRHISQSSQGAINCRSAAEGVEREDRAGGDQLTIRDLAEGTRDQEGNSRLVQSVGPILLFIIGRKGIHFQDSVGDHR